MINVVTIDFVLSQENLQELQEVFNNQKEKSYVIKTPQHTEVVVTFKPKSKNEETKSS